MRTMTKHWKDLYLRLGEIDIEHPLENAVIKQTMRPEEYERRAVMLVGKLKTGDSVLEIGCGYGALARKILNRISVSYSVVDNEAMLNQTKKNLGNEVEYIVADKIETLWGRKFNLFIAHACLSEFPFEYRKYVLKDIMKNCQKASVIDFDDNAKPHRRLIREGWEMLPAITEHYLNEYFVIEKIKRENCRQTQYIFFGERKT